MVLSRNQNGIVIKTGGKGFSTMAVFKALVRLIGDDNITSIDHASTTKSKYLEFTVNGVDYSVRISDHTSRKESFSEINTNLIFSTYMGGSSFSYSEIASPGATCEFEILNSETKSIFFNHIKSVK